MKLVQLMQLLESTKNRVPMETYLVPFPATYAKVNTAWLEELLDQWKQETRKVAVDTVEVRSKAFRIVCSPTTVQKLQDDIEDVFNDAVADKVTFFAEKATELLERKTGYQTTTKAMSGVLLGKPPTPAIAKTLEVLKTKLGYNESATTYKANASTWKALGIDESDYSLISVFSL